MRAKVLSASAGSGKTFRLAYKFIHDTIGYSYSKPYLYRAILAVTFTNKATEQMKSRILAELHTLSSHPDRSKYMSLLRRDLGLSDQEIIKRAQVVQQRILHDYSRFTVLTIDKFFQRILRSFLKELNYDLSYNIELDEKAILAKGVDMLIEDISKDEDLLQWIEEYTQDALDDNKSWDIRKNINDFGVTIFDAQSRSAIGNKLSKDTLRNIVRSLQQRVAKIRAEQTALGQKALNMMADAGVSPDDYMNKSGGFMAIFINAANGCRYGKNGKEDGVYVTPSRLKYTLSPEGWSKDSSAQALAPSLHPLLVRICELESEVQEPHKTAHLIKSTYRSYGVLKDLNDRINLYCKQENLMLLSQTKYILSRFIEDNDAPFIYEKMGNRFERFMIDEFQDTSLIEWRNFVPLLRNAMAQSDDESVLIVGDVKQSIYRWRGGDWRILKSGIAEALGENNTSVEPMKINYRSLGQIVRFNNDIIQHIIKCDNEHLNSALDAAVDENSISEECRDGLQNMLIDAYDERSRNDEGLPEGEYSFGQQVGRRSDKSGYVRVEHFDDQPDFIDCIESAVARGYKYSDMMILCRTGDDSVKVAKTLMDYKRRNNTFNIMTQDSLVIGRASVSGFIISVMRLSQDSNDRISLALMNEYLGRDYDAPAEESDQRFFAAISSLSPEQAFERIVMEYRLNARCEELAYLQAIHEQIISFCSSRSADLQLFLKMWDEKGSSLKLEVEGGSDTIELITIHKAKGLEKKIVIIPYCDWSLTPKSNNLVWAAPDKQDGQLQDIDTFPVLYSEKWMEQSAFSEGYYRELVYSHVESINLLYVALTRACEELYVFIPNKNDKNKVGPLLWSVVESDSNGVKSLDGKRVEFGKMDAPALDADDDDKGKSVMIAEYPTFEQQIRLSLPSQRYFEDESHSQKARNLGITMHTVLSQAKCRQDVLQGITQQQQNGALSAEDASSLQRIIEREFERDLVGEWFGEWDDVRTENDILSSHIVGTRRPDRVMISGDRAVVVDYKFGQARSATHSRQVATYMQLLRDMGYRQVEGYVWYLSIGDIVAVEPSANDGQLEIGNL